MRVHIDKIGPEGLHLEEPVTREWLDETLGPGSVFRGAAGGRLSVDLLRMDDAVHAQGEIEVTLTADCSRCLEPTELALDRSFRVTLFPKGQEPPAGRDGELGEEDMGVSTYEESEVDLSSIVRDEVFLHLPMTPICEETCAGLCPHCGRNLNEGSCDCSPPVDMRWASLKEMKLG